MNNVNKDLLIAVAHEAGLREGEREREELVALIATYEKVVEIADASHTVQRMDAVEGGPVLKWFWRCDWCHAEAWKKEEVQHSEDCLLSIRKTNQHAARLMREVEALRKIEVELRFRALHGFWRNSFLPLLDAVKAARKET